MDYVLNIIPQMMDGCLVSFQVFIITIVLSIPLGILLSLGRVSGIKPLQALIGGYVWILRGSPLMLQIFFVYFVLPSVGIRLPDFESAIVDAVLARGYYDKKKPGAYRILEQNMGDEVVAIAFRKDDKDFKDRIDKAMDEMKKDGTCKKISEKWMGADITKY